MNNYSLFASGSHGNWQATVFVVFASLAVLMGIWAVGYNVYLACFATKPRSREVLVTVCCASITAGLLLLGGSFLYRPDGNNYLRCFGYAVFMATAFATPEAWWKIRELSDSRGLAGGRAGTVLPVEEGVAIAKLLSRISLFLFMATMIATCLWMIAFAYTHLDLRSLSRFLDDLAQLAMFLLLLGSPYLAIYCAIRLARKSVLMAFFVCFACLLNSGFVAFVVTDHVSMGLRQYRDWEGLIIFFIPAVQWIICTAMIAIMLLVKLVQWMQADKHAQE